MNILLLSRFISPEVGGSMLVFFLIANLLAKKGIKVWIITNKIDGLTLPEHKNIKIIFSSKQSVSSVKVHKIIDKLKYNFFVIKNGYRLIKKEEIEIIHSNPLQPTFAGAILSLLTSKPHIIAIHDTMSLKKDYLHEWAKQKGKSEIKAHFGSFITKFTYRIKCSAIHTVSEAVRDDLINFGFKIPIHVIHNALPIKPATENKINPFQFVYIGRLVFHKNIEVLIKAIGILKKTYPMINLILVGDGDYRLQLEKIVNNLDLNDSVIFKGQTSEQDKLRILSQSNALLFPSLHEGFGIVILEAFSQKKPALVSDVRPLSDLIEDNKTGMIIDPYNEKEWAKKMEMLLKNREFALDMGIAGRKILEEKFNLSIMSEKMLDMYNEVITKSIKR